MTAEFGREIEDLAGRLELETRRASRDTTSPRPGSVPAGAKSGTGRKGPARQLRDASASFQVADGRMTAAALAGSGW
jgi:hypothetical protein